MANNEYINKVVFGDTTIMDISDTTAEAGDVVVGKTFYAKSGAQTTGTLDDATQSTHGLMSATDKTKLDGLTSMVVLSYGISTWQDFITAYSNNAVVYCRASSNSNPASGSQTRMAFMAYVNNATNPNNVEFQYYRSMSSHSATAMGDEVYVYKLTDSNGGTWSVTTRKASIKEIAVASGSKLGVSWSSDKVTLSNTMTADDMPMSSSDSTTTKAAIEAKYSKPSGGIPATDLADTYLTAHQDISGKANSADLATVATTGDYDDLINKPTIPTVPTNISSFTNDAGYLTSHQDISGKVSGPSSASDANVALFDGTTGKLIKDSGFTIGTSVPANAVFTDTTYESKTAASGGTDVSLVTTGEKYTWNNKANDADVVHITGNEAVSGEKTFSDYILFKNLIRVQNSATTASISFRGIDLDVTSAAIYCNSVQASYDGTPGMGASRLYCRCYSPTENGAPTSYYENYYLPRVDVGRESNKTYYIYTTKNVKAGNNVSISVDSSTEDITISATDTTYTAGTGITLSGTTFKMVKADVCDALNLLSTGSTDATADTYLVGCYDSTTNTDFTRRKASTVVNATLVKAALGTDGSTTTKCLTQKGTWATFGTSNLAIGTTSSTAAAGNHSHTNYATCQSSTYNTTILAQNSTEYMPSVVQYHTCNANTTISLGKLRNGAIIVVTRSGKTPDVCMKVGESSIYATANNSFTLTSSSHTVSFTAGSNKLYITVIS